MQTRGIAYERDDFQRRFFRLITEMRVDHNKLYLNMHSVYRYITPGPKGIFYQLFYFIALFFLFFKFSAYFFLIYRVYVKHGLLIVLRRRKKMPQNIQMP